MDRIDHTDVEASLQALSETYCQDSPIPSVAVVDGHGVQVVVERGHLEVRDGLGPYRRIRRYAKATHGLSRLVVVGSTGSVSLAAMRWCKGAGVAMVVIDPFDGSVLLTSGACAVDDGRLRRSQALAPATETGFVVARYLTGIKLAGEASIAASDLSNAQVAETIRRLANSLNDCSSLDEIRQLEAAAANLYWRVWERVSVQFIRRDDAKIPDHWRQFEGRRSAVNPGTARNATEPANALLNYSYRLVEAEARLATLSLGLDPGFGLLHADVRNRDGFVLDLMEAARPVAERHVARLISSHHFMSRDFAEDARGVVRVLSPLSHRLAEAMSAFGVALAPVAEHVAKLFSDASPYEVGAPLILSRSKHNDAARRRVGTGGGNSSRGPGANGVAPRKKPRQRPQITDEPPMPVSICRVCGTVVPAEADRDRPRGNYCPECLRDRRREVGAEMQLESLSDAHQFTELTGSRPSQTAEARRRRQAANRIQRADQAAWDADHVGEVFDPDWFRSKVQPGLATVTLPSIAKATGMSTSAAAKVRSGRRIPHPRHWKVLRDVARGGSE